jgi:predicted metal-dependent hydrolase
MGSIFVRDVTFEVDPARAGDWNGGKKGRTAFLNALSILFPPGERFFIASVAAFRDQVVEPELKRAVRDFTTQEALHTREHVAYNRVLQNCVDAARLEAELSEHLDWVKRTFPPIARLGITCALEHFTAIMAHEALTDSAYFENAAPTYRALWTWHALEECEHKSVAFDVFRQITGRSGYFLRIRTMLLTSVTFVQFIAKHVLAIFRAQGLMRSPRAWSDLIWYLFGKPGMVRRILVPYLRYYAPGFHPSEIDDRRELERGRAFVQAWS